MTTRGAERSIQRWVRDGVRSRRNIELLLQHQTGLGWVSPGCWRHCWWWSGSITSDWVWLQVVTVSGRAESGSDMVLVPVYRHSHTHMQSQITFPFILQHSTHYTKIWCLLSFKYVLNKIHMKIIIKSNLTNIYKTFCFKFYFKHILLHSEKEKKLLRFPAHPPYSNLNSKCWKKKNFRNSNIFKISYILHCDPS